MSQPTLKVEADLTGTPFGDPPTWSDLTAYALTAGAGTGVSITGGRQDATSQVAPSTITLTLDNDDRPGDAGGRFNNALIGAPFRVSLTVAGTDYRIGFGIAKSYAYNTVGGSFAVCVVTLGDVLTRFGTLNPLADLLTEHLLSLDPAALYTLQEPEGATSFGDAAGNKAPATVRVSTLGHVGCAVTAGQVQQGLAVGTEVAVTQSPAFGAGMSIETPLHLPSASPFTIVLAAQWPAGATVPVMLAAANRRTGAEAYLGASVSGGLIWALVDDALGVATADIPAADMIDDGLMHVYVVTLEADLKTVKLYVDGEQLSNLIPSAPALSSFTFPGLQLGGFIDPMQNAPVTDLETSGYAYLALIDRALTGTEARTITAIATASFGPAETTADRFNRLAGYRPNYGIYTDPGVGLVGSQDLAGKTLLAALQEAVDAEAGYMFAAANGVVKFFDRSRIFNPAVALTLDASLDQVTTTTSLTKSDQYQVNSATVSRSAGAAQTVTDLASQAQYGVFAASGLTVITRDDDAARDIAGWKVATGKDPQTVSPAVVIDLLTETDAALLADILSFEPLDRVQVTNLPPSSPACDAIIQGWAFNIAIDAMTLTFATTPLPPPVMTWDGDAAHGWDDSAWGF